jgi:hypothetical protein
MSSDKLPQGKDGDKNEGGYAFPHCRMRDKTLKREKKVERLLYIIY